MARKKAPPKIDTPSTRYEQKGRVDHGGIVIQGPDNEITITQQTGLQASELTAMFEAVFKKIDTLPANPDVDKGEIVETVQKIQDEAKKEAQANPNKLERWVTNIAKMAPDILDVMLASLGGPVTGFAAVFKKIVEKARQDAAGSG